LQLYIPPFAATVLGILCVLGAMNVAVIWDFFRLRKIPYAMRIFLNVEHRAIFGIMAFLVLVGLMFSGMSSLGDLILDFCYGGRFRAFDGGWSEVDPNSSAVSAFRYRIVTSLSSVACHSRKVPHANYSRCVIPFYLDVFFRLYIGVRNRDCGFRCCRIAIAQFTNGQMSVGIVLMLLGRIEVLAAIALILPNFWKQ